MKENDFQFTVGGRLLFGRSLLPDGKPVARILFLHGYGDHSGRYLEFFRWLTERNMSCHALDFQGQGRSEGARGFVENWENYLDDLSEFLTIDPGDPDVPLVVIGHSHGGLILAAAALAGKVSNAAGLIFSSPFLGSALKVPEWKIRISVLTNRFWPDLQIPSGIQPEWNSSDPEMVADGIADPLYLSKATPRWYITMRNQQKAVLERAGEITLPARVMFGEDDSLASIETARNFYDRLGSENKDFRSYPGMRHELYREQARERVFGDVLEWVAQQTLPFQPEN